MDYLLNRWIKHKCVWGNDMLLCNKYIMNLEIDFSFALIIIMQNLFIFVIFVMQSE